MTDQEYFALDAVSASFLRDCATSTLAHAFYARSNPSKSAAKNLGSALHCYRLEREQFNVRYVCQPPDLDGRTKEGKAWKANAGERQIVTWDDFNLIKGMDEALLAHPVAGKLLTSVGENEKCIVWDDGKKKAKLDRVTPEGIIDLKTCQDASKDGFETACLGRYRRDKRSYRYDIQAAWYLRAAHAQYGPGTIRFLFVCVESAPPHPVAVYELDEAAIENADEEIDLLLPKIEAAKQSGIWPAYSDKVETLYMPAWMGNSYEVD